MRTPSTYADPPGPPPRGQLLAVRYTNAAGSTVTKLFRQRVAARRYFDRVEIAGGCPGIWYLALPAWEELL